MSETNSHAAVDAGTRSEDKVQQIAQELRHSIVFGRLKPRERLLEEELSARFAVKRHVIRAALEELDRQGLVTRRPNRGAVVSDYSTEEIEQLYDMREILQREAASRIPLPGSRDLIEQLTILNERFQAARDSDDLMRASEENDKFHQTLFNACGNVFLAEAIQHFWVKTASVHSYAIGNAGLAKRSYEEHKSIIDAVRKGDRDELIRLCIDHMTPALDAYKLAHGGWTG